MVRDGEQLHSSLAPSANAPVLALILLPRWQIRGLSPVFVWSTGGWTLADESIDGRGLLATVSHIEQLGAEPFAYMSPTEELSGGLRGKIIALRLLGKRSFEPGMQLL
ncbi:hypothetical protein [Rothia sp. ZJ1223]|uniref:hypothetical protein n=1 Tax=Rothia sp. ZJ1223 TaxID=2811098 RepID=UPI001EF4E589|nr:hypothetical protein [Rothia sp. ZJ1223]